MELFQHQKEAVICMGAVEKMEPWKPFTTETITNLGFLAEPPGSGKTVTMAAHLLNNEAPNPQSPFTRAYDEHNSAPGQTTKLYGKHNIELVQAQTYVTPTYLPISVVVVSHLSVTSWANTLSEVGRQRVVSITSRAEMREFDSIRDGLRDMPERSYDAVVVSMSFFAALATRLRYTRVSRLIIDNVLSCAVNIKIACCFLWFIDDHPARIIDNRYHPPILKDALRPLYLEGIDDPSPIFVFHSRQEVNESMQVEYPLHAIYHIPLPHWFQGFENPPPVSNIIVPKSPILKEKLVANHHVPVWTWDSAPSMVLPTVRERLEAELSSADGCMICTEPYQRGTGACCLLRCCTRLLCCTCTWKIVHTTGTCPICRGGISNKDAAIVMINNRLDVPINITHFYISTLEDKMSALIVILSRIGLGDRVIIFTSGADEYVDGTHFDVGFYLEHQIALDIMPLTGRAQQLKPRLKRYQCGSPTSQRVAVVLKSHQTARGLNLDGTTHVIFYSNPTQSEYEHVLSRVINAGNTKVARKGGRRLKVHMLSKNDSRMPDLYTSYEGIGIGRGRDGESYELGIAGDMAAL
jgi:hypothetical protein